MNRFGFPWQHKGSPKKGRRTSFFQSLQRNNDDDDIGNSDDLLGSPVNSPGREAENVTGKPRRRTGGWAEEIPKSAKKKSFMVDQEDERLKAAHDYDSDNDMPLIPDLDDVQEEDMAQQVAQAPNLLVNRVATYKELDNDLLKHAAFSTLDDIDLRILMKNLASEAELNEPDEPWTWDVLFTEVTSELNSEWETRDEDEERVNSA